MSMTLCTAYFESKVKLRVGHHMRRTNEEYMIWFGNLLKLDANIYIETEEKFIPRITEMRKEVDPLMEKTVIINRRVEDTPAYQLYYEDFDKLINSEEFKDKLKNSPLGPVARIITEHIQALYNVILFNKTYLLRTAMEDNWFNTQYFGWVDCGFIRNHRWVIPQNRQWPDLEKLRMDNGKIKLFCLDDKISEKLKVDTVEDMKKQCMLQNRYIKGTVYFVPREEIDWLISEIEKTARYCLSHGVIGSDEKILDLCYVKNPEKFELREGDWRTEFHALLKNPVIPKR